MQKISLFVNYNAHKSCNVCKSMLFLDCVNTPNPLESVLRRTLILMMVSLVLDKECCPDIFKEKEQH